MQWDVRIERIERREHVFRVEGATRELAKEAAQRVSFDHDFKTDTVASAVYRIDDMTAVVQETQEAS